MSDALRETAPAKVNLTLHVGRVIRDADRHHGYHPLDSLVVFADVGDTLTFHPSETPSLEITGTFAEGLETDATNLVSRALALAERVCGASLHTVHLDKSLPVAAGLGGGSADAGAVVRALCKDDMSADDLLSLGADVPACTLSRTLRMTGIGECVAPLPGLGQVDAVLANPGVAVSTAAIFRALDGHDPRETPRPQAHSGTLLERALAGRNDLQPVAEDLQPAIRDLREHLAASDGCQLARMTGSGASVFALYPTPDQARIAVDTLRTQGVWARSCRLGDPD